MKILQVIAFLIAIFALVYFNTNIYGGQLFTKVTPGLITSSGTTVVTFNHPVYELWFVRVSTNAMYMDSVSSMVTTSSRYLRSGVVIEETINPYSTTRQFSITTSTLPVEFHYEGRGR
jgi:hypothetical protein